MKLIGNLKKKVENAKTKEEARDTIKKAGMLLDDDELEAVSGGAGSGDYGGHSNDIINVTPSEYLNLPDFNSNMCNVPGCGRTLRDVKINILKSAGQFTNVTLAYKAGKQCPGCGKLWKVK